MIGGDSSFLPLKINSSGVMAPIFASSLLLLPATAMGFPGRGGPAIVGGLDSGRLSASCNMVSRPSSQSTPR
jgi:preprotein translocase subunit SecY